LPLDEGVFFHHEKRKEADPAGSAWDTNFGDLAGERLGTVAASEEQ
jgi:hypothetical protein